MKKDNNNEEWYNNKEWFAIDREGRKIRMAPWERVKKYEKIIAEILEVLGYPEALVTDLSTISNFDLSPGELEGASQILGLSLSEEMLLVEIAEEIAKKRES